MTVPKPHRLQISPFVFTFPWRLVQHHHRARDMVALGNMLHKVWPIEGDDISLIIAAAKLFEHRPDELQLILDLRIRDAFGIHANRIGKRRRAAFEAYLLTDDRALIEQGYAYADDQMVRMRIARSKRRLDKIVAQKIAILDHLGIGSKSG